MPGGAFPLAEPMDKDPKGILLWTASAAIWLLAALAIVGAFLGAPRAKVLFNTLPLAVFWAALLVALVAAVGLRAVRRRLGLVAVHLGAASVILGGMIGSDAGHRLANRRLGRNKPPGGYMWLLEGYQSSDLLDEDGTVIARLPFAVRLEEVQTESHPEPDRPWSLYVLSQPLLRSGYGSALGPLEVPWQIGREVAIPRVGGTVEALEYLPHAKAVRDSAGQVITAQPARRGPPALKATVRRGEESLTGWFFGRQAESTVSSAYRGEVGLLYLAPPRDTITVRGIRLAVLSDDRPLHRQLVQVNRPMHWGGYHLYHYGGDPAARSAVLLVRSDSGLVAVYAGLALLLAGVFWHFWGRPIRRRLSRRGTARIC